MNLIQWAWISRVLSNPTKAECSNYIWKKGLKALFFVVLRRTLIIFSLFLPNKALLLIGTSSGLNVKYGISRIKCKVWYIQGIQKHSYCILPVENSALWFSSLVLVLLCVLNNHDIWSCIISETRVCVCVCVCVIVCDCALYCMWCVYVWLNGRLAHSIAQVYFCTHHVFVKRASATSTRVKFLDM